ncbi:OmpA family protein [Candidatus Poribacteria bacterium]|nr:OmpA family protein [Candidatus Poribacteria bacterium]
MNRATKRLGFSLLAAAALLAGACRGEKGFLSFFPSKVNEDGKNEEVRIKRPAPEIVVEEPKPAPPSTTPAPSATPAPAIAKPDVATNPSEVRPQGHAIPELAVIRFALDEDELTAATKTILDEHAKYLASNPGLHVVIRGHTDNRGTEEYNLALGQRRAEAVREYLIGKGIAAGRLETVSFGEGLPIEEGDGPEAQAKNRRAEFFVYEAE